MMNVIFYALIPVVLLALMKNYLLFDEEVILIVSVLIFLGASYNIISGFLVTGLSERAEMIKKNFDNYFFFKVGTLKTLIDTYQKVYETNNELVKVIGVTYNQLEIIKTLRGVEIENFLGYVVNQHLQNILAEELQLFKNIYYSKLQNFFYELQLTWGLQQVKDVLDVDEQQSLEVLDEVQKAAEVINSNKVALLPLSSVLKGDLVFMNNFVSIFRVLGYVSAGLLVDVYVLFWNLLSCKLNVK